MKRSIVAFLLVVLMLLSSSCAIPIIGDFVQSDESLGKTNNTAVTIAAAMKDYLKKKDKQNLSLYGVDLLLNSDGNGEVKLFYAQGKTQDMKYDDIYVAEVDSTTGHVERFSKADFSKDELAPYEVVRNCKPMDVGALPIDSEKAISLAVKRFASNPEFHYDYVQIRLSMPAATEIYSISFISMLNDVVYSTTVDAVTGTLLDSSSRPLE